MSHPKSFQAPNWVVCAIVCANRLIHPLIVGTFEIKIRWGEVRWGEMWYLPDVSMYFNNLWTDRPTQPTDANYFRQNWRTPWHNQLCKICRRLHRSGFWFSGTLKSDVPMWKSSAALAFDERFHLKRLLYYNYTISWFVTAWVTTGPILSCFIFFLICFFYLSIYLHIFICDHLSNDLRFFLFSWSQAFNHWFNAPTEMFVGWLLRLWVLFDVRRTGMPFTECWTDTKLTRTKCIVGTLLSLENVTVTCQLLH